MYKITELVGKKLIDVNTARDLGGISGIAWNKQAGKCAIMTDEGSWTAEKIFSVKDAVSVVNPIPAETYEELALGKTAYDTTGKYLGKLKEIEFGNTLKIGYVHLDSGTPFSRGKLYALGDVLLIRARMPASPINKQTKAKDTDAQTAKSKKLTAARWLQNRRYGDFSFLIGKTVDKTITNFQGELMIKQGERVTNTILRQAKVSGKLIELCLHTK
ncbi:MAG: hypothetical protein J1F66_01400 [Clostridiales bacterium]|nr:hypothetical protein [Clostridiales bacterium]